MIAPTDGGTIISMDKFSSALPSLVFPDPLAIAFSMESLAKPVFLADAMRVASRGFEFGSPPWSENDHVRQDTSTNAGRFTSGSPSELR